MKSMNKLLLALLLVALSAASSSASSSAPDRQDSLRKFVVAPKLCGLYEHGAELLLAYETKSIQDADGQWREHIVLGYWREKNVPRGMSAKGWIDYAADQAHIKLWSSGGWLLRHRICNVWGDQIQ